jgi:hypothetical protein
MDKSEIQTPLEFINPNRLYHPNVDMSCLEIDLLDLRFPHIRQDILTNRTFLWLPNLCYLQRRPDFLANRMFLEHFPYIHIYALSEYPLVWNSISASPSELLK